MDYDSDSDGQYKGPQRGEHADALGADSSGHERKDADNAVLKHAADDNKHGLGADLEGIKDAVNPTGERVLLGAHVRQCNSKDDNKEDRREKVAIGHRRDGIARDDPQENLCQGWWSLRLGFATGVLDTTTGLEDICDK